MAYQNQKRDRNFNRRDRDDRHDHHRGNGRQKRNPLDWTEAKRIEVEDVCIIVSQAEGDDGNTRSSFSIGRLGRDGRTSKFLQPRDKQALADALDQAFSFMGV
jgi:hypothetical protein